MKQAEKLDKILRYLYDNKGTPGYYSTLKICQELNIPLEVNEGWRLAERLRDDQFVKSIGREDGLSLEITTYGIDYVENESYSRTGVAISETHYHYNISEATNTSFISNSQNVKVHQTASKADAVLTEIERSINSENLPSERLEEIMECISEIRKGVANNSAPKFAYKSLVSMTSDITSIAGFLITLGQALGVS